MSGMVLCPVRRERIVVPQSSTPDSIDDCYSTPLSTVLRQPRRVPKTLIKQGPREVSDSLQRTPDAALSWISSTITSVPRSSVTRSRKGRHPHQQLGSAYAMISPA